MGGPIASLLDISRRTLNNTAQGIRVIGNNISNANNDSYNRREVQLVDVTTRNPTETSFGLGTRINVVARKYDQFTDKMHRGTLSDLGRDSVRTGLLERAEDPFSVDRTLRSIGYEMGQYFSAFSAAQLDPTNAALRSQIITAGNNLAQSIRMTYETLAGLQREADTRIRLAVEEVNSLTTRIAELNVEIQASETGAQQNLGLRDERERAMRELSQKVSYSSIEDADGKVLVYLSNGFPLVTGSGTRRLETTASPSFGGFPPALDGGPLSTIVWDADSTPGVSHINLENILRSGSGEIAGLLQFRGVPQTGNTSTFQALGDVVEVAARIEALTRNLLIEHNNIYRPLDGGVVASATPTGAPPPFLGLWKVDSTALIDSDSNNIVTSADLAASGLSNFSSKLLFSTQIPGNLALAADEDPTPGVVAFSPGNGGIARNLAEQRFVSTTFSAGTFSQSGIAEDIYVDTVSFVGAKVARAKSELEVSRSREQQMREIRASTSGVNLDEELAKLISIQRSYQAAARLIRTGDELLQTVLQALG
jgi:flagellar hook-associated protein 1 FlgK